MNYNTISHASQIIPQSIVIPSWVAMVWLVRQIQTTMLYMYKIINVPDLKGFYMYMHDAYNIPWFSQPRTQ